MQRLSSSLTIWWYKRLGPLLLGVAFLVGTAALAISVARGAVDPAWLIMPPLVTLLVWAYLRRFVFPLADEVFDAGDALLVRRGPHTERIAFCQITSVDYSLVFDPPRITVRFTSPQGGAALDFMPRLFPGMCFFRSHPLVENLRTRIDRAADKH